MSIKCRPMYPLGPRANSLFSYRDSMQVGPTQYQYSFPNPFLLFGFAANSSIGAGGLYFRFVWQQNVFNNNNFNSLAYPLNIAMMYANRASGGGTPDPFPGAVSYTEVEAWGKFLGYFDNYMNPQLFMPLASGDPSVGNYQTFLTPLEAIQQFWNNIEIARPDGSGYANPKLEAYEMLCKLFGCGTDKRLWNAPGVYIIDVAGDFIAAGASALLTRVEANDICPHTTTFQVVAILHSLYPGAPLNSYVWFEAGPGLPVDPGTVIAGDANVPYAGAFPNPPDLAGGSIAAWLTGVCTDLGGFPPDMAVNHYDLTTIGTPTGDQIQFIIDSTIDGCVAPNFNGTLPGNIFTMNMKFQVANPFIEQFRQYIADNGGAPTFVSAEYMIPS